MISRHILHEHLYFLPITTRFPNYPHFLYFGSSHSSDSQCRRTRAEITPQLQDQKLLQPSRSRSLTERRCAHHPSIKLMYVVQESFSGIKLLLGLVVTLSGVLIVPISRSYPLFG